MTPAAPDTKAQGILAKESVTLLLGNYQRKRSARIPQCPHQERGPSIQPLVPAPQSSRAHGHAGLIRLAAVAGPRAASPPPSRSVAAVPLPAL